MFSPEFAFELFYTTYVSFNPTVSSTKYPFLMTKHSQFTPSPENAYIKFSEKCLTNLESNQLSRYISISEEINDNNFH